MFPEYRHLMTHLKKTHPRFQSLFERHNQLDHEIIRLESTTGQGYCDNVVRLKKEKLHIKDEIHKILLTESLSG
ncbi:YdcH family protein [Yersinia intermedia]|uniref:YdcH family protein n=1 Tax=Yersinia intermedia TaxID=631 RepID=UPI0022FE152F|nr:YdcH family protein [Yersinia intermedia]MDA5483256.1 YdcH family protein [Yersinia intermedia]